MIKRFAQGSLQADISGAGPSVWLLHSLLADAGSCAPLARALAASYRVVLVDLPGFGGSPPSSGLADTAARIATAMEEDAKEQGGPGILIANGYGSFVALLTALRRPDAVRRLVLAGTGATFSEPGRAAFRAMAAGAAAKGLEGIAEVAMRRLFSPEFQAANPDLVSARRTRFLATDPGVFAQACDDLAALDLRSDVPSLAMPLMVLVGEGDEATPPGMARELASLVPGAEFKQLPGLAHVPQLQDTAGFLKAIEPFLSTS